MKSFILKNGRLVLFMLMILCFAFLGSFFVKSNEMQKFNENAVSTTGYLISSFQKDANLYSNHYEYFVDDTSYTVWLDETDVPVNNERIIRYEEGNPYSTEKITETTVNESLLLAILCALAFIVTFIIMKHIKKKNSIYDKIVNHTTDAVNNTFDKTADFILKSDKVSDTVDSSITTLNTMSNVTNKNVHTISLVLIGCAYVFSLIAIFVVLFIPDAKYLSSDYVETIAVSIGHSSSDTHDYSISFEFLHKDVSYTLQHDTNSYPLKEQEETIIYNINNPNDSHYGSKASIFGGIIGLAAVSTVSFGLIFIFTNRGYKKKANIN